MTNTKIQINEYYYTNGDSLICCGEVQFKAYCIEHDEPQGCTFCESDQYSPCECD